MVVGDIFKTINNGDVLILSEVKKRKVKIKFLDTGSVIYANYDNVVKGKVKDKCRPSIYGVGYIGDGSYKATSKGRISKPYQVWRGMMERSYSEKLHRRAPTYKGCEVHPDWHNFQNFAKWYEVNYPNDGNRYELDKDIKFEGNKIYSPETCLFVSKADNVRKATSKWHFFTSPSGELFEVDNLTSFCEDKELSYRSMLRISLGTVKKHQGWTIWK